MQSFPHHYSVSATAATQGDVAIQGDKLPTIASAPPIEFGGPGDRWSPETLPRVEALIAQDGTI